MRVLLPALVLLALAACQPAPPSTPAPSAPSPGTGLYANVALAKLEIKDKGFAKSVMLGLPVENRTGKAIQAFKGEVLVYDIFDDDLAVISFVAMGDIPPGNYTVAIGTKMLNRYVERDVRLMKTPPDKLRYVWRTTSIAYADGSRWDAAP